MAVDEQEPVRPVALIGSICSAVVETAESDQDTRCQRRLKIDRVDSIDRRNGCRFMVSGSRR